MSKRLLFSLSVFVFALLASSSTFPTEESQDGPQEIFLDARNSYFMFIPPAGWTLQEYSDPRTKVAFLHPSERDVFLRLIVREAPGTDFATVQGFDFGLAAGMRAKGVKCEMKEVTQLGVRANEISAVLPGDGGVMVIRKWLVGGLHFNAQYMAPTKSVFEQHEAEALQALETMVVFSAVASYSEKARQQHVANCIRMATLVAGRSGAEEARKMLAGALRDLPDSEEVKKTLRLLDPNARGRVGASGLGGDVRGPFDPR